MNLKLVLILKLLDLVAQGVRMGPELKRRYDRHSRKVRDMVENDRKPTDEEMQEILAEGEDLTARIAEAVERKRGFFARLRGEG